MYFDWNYSFLWITLCFPFTTAAFCRSSHLYPCLNIPLDYPSPVAIYVSEVLSRRFQMIGWVYPDFSLPTSVFRHSQVQTPSLQLLSHPIQILALSFVSITHEYLICLNLGMVCDIAIVTAATFVQYSLSCNRERLFICNINCVALKFLFNACNPLLNFFLVFLTASLNSKFNHLSAHAK